MWHFAVVTILLLTISCARAPIAPQENRQKPQTVARQSQSQPSLPTDYPKPARAPMEFGDGERRRLLDIRQLTALGRNGDAAFDLSGEQLVFQTLRPPVDVERLVLIGRDGLGERFLADAPVDATGATFVGEDLVFSVRMQASKDSSGQHQWQLVKLRSGTVVPLRDSGDNNYTDARDAYYAKTSDELFFSALVEGQRDIFVRHMASGRTTRLTTTPVDEGAPAATDDGTRLAFWRASGAQTKQQRETQQSEVFLLDRKLGIERQLTKLGCRNWATAMHPSGRFVIFGSGYIGQADHDLMTVDMETLVVERITYHVGFDGLPRFDPSGRYLVWTSSRQGGMPQLFLARWVEGV